MSIYWLVPLCAAAAVALCWAVTEWRERATDRVRRRGLPPWA